MPDVSPMVGERSDTTTSQAAKKPLKPASPTKPVKAAPVTFRLYVRAVHGNCWMDVRNWSSSGKSRYTGTVELGQDQRDLVLEAEEPPLGAHRGRLMRLILAHELCLF